MAMIAQDGSRHHSASRARLHDELGAKKAPIAPMKKPEGEGADKYPAPSSHSIEEHVDEHGPAHKIEYHHDAGTHHISSHHGEAPADGAEGNPEASHHSRHKTHHAAHQHMAKAMGMNKEEEQEERDNESPDEEYEEETGKGIPGLAS